MNNNNLDQVTMRSSKRKRCRIPQKFVNDTSFGIGEIQPLVVRKCLSNSKTRLRVGNVVRLAPMVAPTFGQLKLHHNFSFVGMSDVLSSDIYNGYLTQKPVAFSSGLVQVPQQMPQMPLNVLCAFALVGAKWTLLQPRDNHTDGDDKTEMHRFLYQSGASTPVPVGVTALSGIRWVGTGTNSAENFLLHVAGLASDITDTEKGEAFYNENPLWKRQADEIALYGSGGAFEGYDKYVINIGRVFGFDRDLWLPCANAEMPLFYYPWENANQTIEGIQAFNAGLVNLSPVDYTNYDFIIRTRMPYGDGTSKVSAEFLVKLSDFGIRFFKLLMASGVGFDFKSEMPVDLTRFVAMYQAWFNSFGITLYQGWESCAARRLMSAYESAYRWDFGSLVTDSLPTPTDADFADYQTLFKFLRELADMWYTEEQDYITAHSRNAAVSSDDGIVTEFALSGTPNVNGILNISTGAITSDVASEPLAVNTHDSGTGGHAYINNVLHSQLDSEVLKRLYKVTNRNTIAGRRIAELLKAQGLGQYVKQCRSTFIGHHSVDIDIFDVTATADSTNVADSQSSILGEYVGKGVGEGNSKWVSYEAPEVGYLFDLACIVPESGWTNGVDLTAFDVRPLQQYHPEYDGLGLELSPKSVVVGVGDSFSLRDEDGQPSPNEESFGFIPRYTRYKVARNVLNGSFSLHSVRRSFQCFNLDKIVQLGERVLNYPWQQNGDSHNFDFGYETKLLTAAKLPIASPIYRYLARYPWMGSFMRIFSSVGRDAVNSDPHYWADYDASLGSSEASWLFFRSDDPFNVHNVFMCDYWAPVLPIEDSFETHEDGNNGPTDMAIGKA